MEKQLLAPALIGEHEISVLCQCISIIAEPQHVGSPQNIMPSVYAEFVKEGIDQRQEWLFHWRVFQEQVITMIQAKANQSQLISKDSHTQQNLISLLNPGGRPQAVLSCIYFDSSLPSINQPTITNQDGDRVSEIYLNNEQSDANMLQQVSSSIQFYSVPDRVSDCSSTECQHTDAYKYPNIDQQVQYAMQEYYEYLVQLDHPGSQLNYLCQQAEWKLGFDFDILLYDRYERWYSCMAYVLIPVRCGNEFKYYLFEGRCLAAISKKIAKSQASLFCLLDLYSNIEGLFERYKLIKISKTSLQLSMSSNNWLLLNNYTHEQTQSRVCLSSKATERRSRIPIYTYTNKEGRQLFTTLQPQLFIDLPVQSPKQRQKHTFKKPCQSIGDVQAAKNSPKIKQQINSYMQCVNNYKRELYNFVHQNFDIFMQPVWSSTKTRKTEILEISVKYLSGAEIKEYRSIGTGNRKHMQQKICRRILQEIYEKHYELYNHFKTVKDRKMLH